MFADIEVELSQLERAAYKRAAVKMAAQQLGEAWVGLDDRRHVGAMRGEDRREWKEAA